LEAATVSLNKPFKIVGECQLNHLAGKRARLGVDEFAVIFLTEQQRAELAPLLREEFGRDPWTITAENLDPLPILSAGLDLEKMPAASIGRAHQN
jgi:GGDEF domain-containing protein